MARLVNWYNFRLKLREKSLLLFSSKDIHRLFGSSQVAIDFLLQRYAKKGFIIRVKQGLYVLADSLPPDLFIANKLYEPSYVSLTFALSYHRVIPETVYEITSVTTKSTRRFEALGKNYSYRSIQKNAFTGYRADRQKGFSFLIAEPEKAFVDLNYLRLHDQLDPLTRFNKDKINPVKARHYARLFNHAKLLHHITTSLH